jgi:DNA-binding LytR/AlgR family response regulator
MKKYSCYIVDDEPLAIDVLESYVKKLDHVELVGLTTDPIKALREVKEVQPDLLFVDIEMPGLHGLDLIRTIKNPPAIVITTAYREFAVEGFELDVLDYLVKPISFERFLQALEKYERIQLQLENGLDQDFLIVRANRKQVKISIRDIVMIEGLKDYIKIRLEKEEILTKLTLTDVHHQLNQDQFIRVHKSYIVSKAKITAFSTTDVELGKLEIPIGRTYKEEFVKIMSGG